jgi:hypothetical protein
MTPNSSIAATIALVKRRVNLFKLQILPAFLQFIVPSMAKAGNKKIRSSGTENRQ